MSELRDAAKRVLADPHDLDALVALERAVYATPDRADPLEQEDWTEGRVESLATPDRADPLLTPDGYDQRSWEAGWNAALEDTPDRDEPACAHCGLPKGDPSACRYYCTEPHDYAEHATPDRADSPRSEKAGDSAKDGEKG